MNEFVQAGNVRLSNNSLTGPAFPRAWLEPAAMQHLTAFEISGNAGLTGTLPASLCWPKLAKL